MASPRNIGLQEIVNLLAPDACLCVPDAACADNILTDVVHDSRTVTPGSLFVCIRGFEFDGHSFAARAVESGAAALIVEEILPLSTPQIVVPNTKAALAAVSAAFYGDPSQSVAVFGITGTNGKTTTTYILDSILRQHGLKTGIVGTVEVRCGDRRLPAGRTTPESSELQRLLGDMVEEGVGAVSMEVSSHAIDLHRVDAVQFAAVAFTNLTQDHLDYHHTLDAYFAVKSRLFTDFPAKARIVDVDTEHGKQLADRLRRAHDVLTVGRNPDADVRAEMESADALGTDFTLVTPLGSRKLRLPLAGAYNVSNALVAAGCALSFNIPLDTVCSGLERAPQVPGRLERVDAGQPFTVVVDYAHTPDSLDKALRAMREVTVGNVISVFGCGGDRDPAKRPVMGTVSAEAADYSIVTSDNPRTEDPIAIILQIEDGIRAADGEHEVVVDRRAAIGRALEIARAGDSVLIAGKGHEDYQVFADHTVHFDDREVARELLGAMGFEVAGDQRRD